MRLVKIGLGNVNSTVGAVDSNLARLLGQAEAMAAEQVTVGIFPEQVIGGYPPEDLVQWQGFVDAQWRALDAFAASTQQYPVVYVLGLVGAPDGLPHNCAAVVAGGVIHGLVPKEKLPNYNIFYEGRTLSRGLPDQITDHRGVPFGDLVFSFDFGLIAVEVCEDLWSPDGPMRRRAHAGAELVCNVSASPLRIGVIETRRELINTRSADNQCTVAYVNAIGANDGLIFDGGGYVSQNGNLLASTPRFRQGWEGVVIDLDRTIRLRTENTTWREDRERYIADHELPFTVDCTAAIDSRASRSTLRYPAPGHGSFFLPKQVPVPTARELLCEEILDALALGVGDYFEKVGAFDQIGVSLSGGRDSLLTLLIAHRHASRARPDDPGSLLRAFYQPSRYSSAETQHAAETICQDLGVPLKVISIDEAFERERQIAASMLDSGETLTPITEQNIQARLRAQRMWNWANSSRGLFLQTGNMTEKAVGYTTIGGDLMGALAVLANVPKTVVIYLLDYLHEKHGYSGIAAALEKPAGPELAPDQFGEDELMPFPVLDACFYLFAGEKMLPVEVELVLAEMFPEYSESVRHAHVEKFVRLFLQSIYKWVQSPLSLHIGNLDLDRERALQLPVVTRSEWTCVSEPVVGE